MTTTILDDLFDEAALTEITAHTPNIGGAYTTRNISGGGTPTLRIAAGAGYAYAHAGSTGITNAAALSTTDWDTTAEFDRVSSSAFPSFRLGCQMTGVGAGYLVLISHYGNWINLYKISGWAATDSHVAAWTGGLPSGAETLRIQKRGAVIKVFLNGTERISYTDPSPLTAGTLTLFGWDGSDPSDGRINRITTTQEDTSDTTAPTLTSPTATATGSTTASGTVSTNEANGTLYRLASTNASETAATVKAAALTQAVSATGTQAVTFSGLTASTTYYAHYVHRDAAGNDSAVASSASFTTAAAGDVTPPTLSAPSGTATGTTTASGSVTTNEANGTLYRYASTNASESAATIKAAGLTQAVSATGAQAVSFTGLTPGTTYYAHFVHRDAAGNDSAVASSAAFTTTAVGATLTSQPLQRNSTTLSGATTLSWCAIHNESTGAFVALKTGVTVNSSSIFSVSDAALVAGTEYRLTWREAGGQKGTASVVAA